MMSVHGSELSDGDADDLDAVGSAAGDEIELGDLEALRGVVKFPVRIKCANLSWNTLELVLESDGAET
jgi:nitrogen fixation NifU-like protein